MIKKGMTIREAAERWVTEFNRFPYSMIEKLMQIDECSWREVTVPSVGDMVYIWNFPDEDTEGNELDTSENTGEIIGYIQEEEMYHVELDDGVEVLLDESDFEVKRESKLPMWGWLWQFDDSCDDYWLEEKDGIRIMSDCGFRIYEHDEWGYFFGIDGCGYDFYEDHWIPAYKKRGLQWHDPATELTEEVVAGMLKEFIEDEELIEKLLKLRKGNSINVGGYYGSLLKKTQAQKLGKIGWFDVDFRHETVQEMSGRYDNDYYIISKEV